MTSKTRSRGATKKTSRPGASVSEKTARPGASVTEKTSRSGASLIERPSRRKDLTISVALFCCFAVLAWVVQTDRFGLLDWDTYGRAWFLGFYMHKLADSHMLYHGVLLWLMSLGWSPLSAIYLVNGVAYGLFVALLYWVARDAGLSLGKSALVLLVAVLGSPGLVALLLIVEDNVVYFPVLLLLFTWMPRAVEGIPKNLRLGAYSGIALAIGMMFSISLLFFLFAVLATPILFLWGKREHALRVVTMVAVAVGVYYLVHLVVFPENAIALPHYFMKAVHLEDFEQSTTPLLSLGRLHQTFTGFRAVAWLPTAHFMWIPDVVRDVVFLVPWLLTAAYVGVAGYHLAIQRSWLASRWQVLLVGGLFYGLALIFPLTYEPYLIERWDIFWIGLLVLSIRLLSHPVPTWTRKFLAVMLCTHLAASGLVIANHFGVAVGPFHLGGQVVNGREFVRFVRQQKVDVLFVPFEDDLMQTIYVWHHVRPVAVFLVKKDGPRTTYVRFNGATDSFVPKMTVWRAVSEAERINIDPRIKDQLLRDFPAIGNRSPTDVLYFQPQ